METKPTVVLTLSKAQSRQSLNQLDNQLDSYSLVR